MMIGIVLIHLGQLNAAANELVGDYNLDHSAVLIYLHGIRRLIHHIALRRGNFTDHILAIGDTCKGEAAVLCGNGGQDRLSVPAVRNSPMIAPASASPFSSFFMPWLSPRRVFFNPFIALNPVFPYG